MHLELIRSRGPLPSLSAIPFESNYAHLRQAISQGTPTIPKSALQAMYIRLLKNHCCQKSCVVRDKETLRRDDRHVYKFDKTSKQYRFYRIMALKENGVVEVSEASIAKTDFGVKRPNLPWSKVGAFAFRFYSHIRTLEKLDTFAGKAIHINSRTGRYLFAIPTCVLREN